MANKKEDTVEKVTPDTSAEANKGDETTEIEIEAPQNSAEDAKQEVTIESDASNEDNDPTKEDLEQKALNGKTTSLEKERLELTNALKQQFDVLDETFRTDPVAYEKWRQSYIRKVGKDPGDHVSIYGAPQSTQSQPSVQDIQTTVRQTLRQEQEFAQGFSEFVKDIPEMDPNNLKTPQDKEKAAQIWNKVSSVAAALRSTDTSIPIGKAFIYAYRALPENMQNEISRAEERGELAGRAGSYVQGMANTGTSGSISNKPKLRVKMTESQRSTYNRLLKDDPKVANRYARSIAEG